MSAKWERSKRWDDTHLTGALRPVKHVLRAFSSIWLAVILLSFVSLYSVLASVPIGMLALIPTYVIYGATALIAIGLIAALPVLLARRLLPLSGAGRFAFTVVTGLVLTAAALQLWATFAWPRLQYDPVHETGLRLFSEFVARYDATTLRRLPAFEMTEPQFYAWWPLRLALLLFVVNMITTTVRRIEFSFPNIGVLTVHSGIVILALGSMHYQALKQEGDMLLIAPTSEGVDAGPLVSNFYDRDLAALWINQGGRGWEQRPLPDLPRYNDYGFGDAADRRLDLPPMIGPGPSVDDDIALKVTGYASYAELQEGWRIVEDPVPGADTSPLLDVRLLSSISQDGGGEERTVGDLRLAAASPADRVASLGDGVITIEYVPPDHERSWRRLTSDWPGSGSHALALSAPGAEEPVVIMVEPGESHEYAGHGLEVLELLPRPPFPIITAGYEGARSAVAVLEVSPPEGDPYTRYVYHRFPEINQDVLGVSEEGRPDRRNADPAINIEYLHSRGINVYLRTGGEWAIRLPGGEIRTGRASVGERISLLPGVSLAIDAAHEQGMFEEHPLATPAAERERDMIGNHMKAAMRVEASLPGEWRRSVWIPFTKYMGLEAQNTRTLTLPDGRTLRLAFGRLSRQLPGMALQLVDFEMVPYAHSDVPRDFFSQVRIVDLARGETYVETTRLNDPLVHHVPFRASDEQPALANALGWLITRIAPNQYKFSQAGWDAQGWRESAQAVKEGRADRPQASFTILGVGNNPGIYIIATGAVLVAIGIPWAFYIKPLIMRRRRDRLKREHAARCVRNENSRRRAPNVAATPADREVEASLT